MVYRLAAVLAAVVVRMAGAAGHSAGSAGNTAGHPARVIVAAAMVRVRLRRTDRPTARIWRTAVAPLGEELVKGECKAVERIAGVLSIAACAAAILFGQANVIGRHQQLDITFEADDRELSERYKQPV